MGMNSSCDSQNHFTPLLETQQEIINDDTNSKRLLVISTHLEITHIRNEVLIYCIQYDF